MLFFQANPPIPTFPMPMAPPAIEAPGIPANSFPRSSIEIKQRIIFALGTDGLTFNQIYDVVFPTINHDIASEGSLRLALAELFDDRIVQINVDYPSFYSLLR